MFTEAQYHSQANRPYHWSNVVQIKMMSNTVGLMVGMSMSDRNVRRLLDALRRTPVRAELYAILQIPEVPDLKADEVHQIRTAARRGQRFRLACDRNRLAGRSSG